MKFSVSNFLIRPRPFKDESLSSWRQRSGWKNGYTLYPTPDERTRRVDSDIGLQKEVMAWLVNSHSLRDDDLHSMTLLGYVGKIVSSLNVRDQPRWWLRARYGKSSRTYGPMFCPRCLDSVDEAYFRFNWRLGFVTTCVFHGNQLLDSCPSCRSPPWPSGLSVKGKLSEKFTSLMYCWYCGFDMRAAKVRAADPALTRRLLDGLSSGEMTIGGKSLPVLDVLDSLWAASQIFIRKRSRERLIETESRWGYVAKSLSEDVLNERTIEGLRVKDRGILLSCAWEIINAKEESLLNFCREGKLMRFHFDGALNLQPDWMNAAIESELPSRRRPEVDEAEIVKFIENFNALNGRLPAKYELRERYGSQSKRVMNCLQELPADVVAVKFDEFCNQISAMLNDAQEKNTLLFKHCAFDLAAILLSLLEVRSLSDIAKLKTSEIVARLRRAEIQGGANPIFIRCVQRVLIAVDDIQPLGLKPVDYVLMRQVRKRRAALMNSLMMQSVRDHLVFAAQVM